MVHVVPSGIHEKAMSEILSGQLLANTIAALAVSLSLMACGNRDVSTNIPDCEAKYYAEAGTKAYETASVEYLKNKAESCRVCMVQKGFKVNIPAWEKIAEERRNEARETALSFAATNAWTDDFRKRGAEVLCSAKVWE